jgi:single-strand DNA-binding protein
MVATAILIGRITKDIEVKPCKGVGDKPNSVANFCLASQANKKAKPVYISCAAFGKTAENLKETCVKGTLLYADGNLVDNSYTDKKGQKHNGLQVQVNKFVILKQPQEYWAQQQQPPAPPQQTQGYWAQQQQPPAPPQQPQGYWAQQQQPPAPPQQTQEYWAQQQQFNDFVEC